MSLLNDEAAGAAPDQWHGSIPDLKDLFDKQILVYLLNTTFRGRGPRKHPAVALTVQFVTLTDKATYEYKQGRAELVTFLDRPAQLNLISPMFRASDHFETCVTTLYRASRFLVKVAGCRDAPTVVREDRRYVEHVLKRLKDVRDAIEHMEEQLLADVIAEGEAVSLFPDDQGLEIGHVPNHVRRARRVDHPLPSVGEGPHRCPASRPRREGVPAGRRCGVARRGAQP